MSSQRIRRVAGTCIGILLLVYVIYQFHIATKKGLDTEMVTYATVSDFVQADALAIREEKTVSAPYSGILSYVLADGSNVGEQGTIAQVYQNEADAAAQTLLSRVDNEIDTLQKLLTPGDNYISNPGLIGTQIYTALGNFCQGVQRRDFSKLPAMRDSFHLALSRKNTIAGLEKTEDYAAKLDALNLQRENLASKAENQSDKILADASGYFSNAVDGYESILTPDRLSTMPVSQVKELMERTPATVAEQDIGKIITNFKWYFVAVLPQKEAIKLQGLNNVNIDVPFATNEKIPASIVAKNRSDSGEETAFVFECGYMNPELAKIRKETIRIELKSYEGLLVNEKAIHFIDYKDSWYNEETGKTETTTHQQVKGVFIKNGARVKFVQIFSDKSLNGYAICKTNLSEEENKSLVTGSSINLYDEVIMEGTDLYDGKFV